MAATQQVNPYARPSACNACNDSRTVTRYVTARKDDTVPCPTCGNLDRDEYDRFRRDAWTRDHVPPSICELDLTPVEFEVYQRARRDHPAVLKLTVLSWMEGQRFDPSKDEDFLVEAREEFRKWRARP